MTDRNIEKYLAEAIEKNTPDILDDLLKELGPEEETTLLRDRLSDETDGFTEAVPVKKPAGSWIRAAAGMAAALVLVVGGLNVYQNSKVFAVVGLDVNPSIELTIGRNEKVKEVRGVNSEGEDILSGMELKGVEVNTACNAITGAMLSKGYLTDTSNSVLISVRADDPEKGKAIEHELADNLNAYLGDSEVKASILGQYVEDDDALDEFADSNGISIGKAWLIRNLLASGSTRMTEESLLKLSTQELILLGQEKKVSSESSYGSADTSKYVSRDKAIEAALAKAGVSRDQATGIKAEFDADDGVIVYEVEFISGGREYEYDVEASTGKILKAEAERADSDDRYDDDGDSDDDRYDDSDDDDRDDDDRDDDRDRDDDDD